MQPVQPRYDSYLQDESRLRGHAESIAFPEDTQALADILSAANRDGQPVTMQGSRTGLCGGAVPEGGLIVNTSRMNTILGLEGEILHSMAGASLHDIEAAAAREGMYFPPNPTEATATIGGVFATGAAGPNSLYHGKTSTHIEWLRWVTRVGKIWDISRGCYIFDGTGCPLPGGGRLQLTTDLPQTPIQAMIPRPGMDLIDFLSGSEGRLGAAAEFKLRLQPLPKALWGVVYFSQSDDSLIEFTSMLRDWQAGDMAAYIICAEYYDISSLRLLDASRHNAAMSSLPPFPEADSAIYVELQGEDEDALEQALMTQLDGFLQCGGLEENTWAESGLPAVARLRAMRHALPELVGEHIPDGKYALPRLETDYTGPADKLPEYLRMYSDGLQQSGVHGIIYGHLLQNKLHVAFLPKDGETQSCTRAMDIWANKVADDGGLLAGENGIGRLKAGLVNKYLSPEQRQLISILDGVGWV